MTSGFSLDSSRLSRRGIPEAIYGPGKDPEVLRQAFQEARDAFGLAIATRLDDPQARDLTSSFPHARWDEGARIAWLGDPLPEKGHRILILAAGTADMPVAREASRAAHLLGLRAEIRGDVGVAGLHRLLSVISNDQPLCYVACAGMDGALPAVLAGLVRRPVLAVPTSQGYGVAKGGRAALLAMLASCAEGVAVMNIDNGYGAAVFAALMAAPK